MSAFNRKSFYRNLSLQRCMLMSSPFWLAAAASQDLNAQLTINVTTAAQLRAAITTVNGSATNDTINIAAGGYGITVGALENANVSGDFDITKATGNLLISGAGASTTFIDGTTFDRVFHINAGAASTITIQNLTIRTGRATDNGTVAGEGRGGGILLEAGNLGLIGVVMSNNGAVGANGSVGTAGTPASASGFGSTAVGGNGGAGTAGSPARGGAIYAASNVSIDGCTLFGNVVTGGDGGAGGAGGAAIGNYSATGGDGGTGGSGGNGEGGAVYVAAGTITVIASTVYGGASNGGLGGAGGNGGNAGGIASLTTALICNGGTGGVGGAGGNGSGGGVFVNSGTLNLRNSTVTSLAVFGGNGANGGNGGAATGVAGASVVVNSGGNGAGGGNSGNPFGGGVFAAGGTVSIANSTVSGANATAGTGGGVGAGGAPGGAAGSPAGTATPSAGGGMFVGGATVTVDSSIFADSTASSGADVEGSLAAGASLFEAAPNGTVTPGTGANITGTDPGLAALANNGGPTQTRAITGASAAANVGTNPLALTTDQRGAGFPRVVGAAADMGAFEIQTGGGGQTTAPTVTNPAAAVTVNAATFNVQGTAVADSLVRIYSDLNNNGAIDGADAVVGSQQLTGGATAFSVSVPLTQDLANDFTATADDATNTESTPVNVPTITEDSAPPAGLVVTTPAAPVNTVGANFNIIGTAEANSLVQIYSDANNNGLIDGADAVVASGTATGGNFNIATPIALGTANNFTATAEDAAGNESGPTDVPTITETTTVTSPPVVTTPATAVTVNQATFNIIGTAVADSTVRIYSDANNNGLIDGVDAVVGTQILTGGATAFSVAVTLTQNAANNFTATADDAANPESNPVNVPTITDNAGGGTSGDGGGDGGGGCSTGAGTSAAWLGFGAMFAGLFAAMRGAFRRREEV